MKVIDTSIPDLKIIQPQIFSDQRGVFFETFRSNWFKKNVADVTFVQDNHSQSSFATLRGLHYQIQHAQGKLLRVSSGEVFDVAIDMRQSSPTFGQWDGAILSAENKRQLWVPKGFAHGFYVTSDSAELIYKCTDYYSPDDERYMLWNDADLAIDWPIIQGKKPLLSTRDEAGLSFKESECYA